MISVYYNQKYGFLIVPNAIERFMGCYTVSYTHLEPTRQAEIAYAVLCL